MFNSYMLNYQRVSFPCVKFVSTLRLGALCRVENGTSHTTYRDMAIRLLVKTGYFYGIIHSINGVIRCYKYL